MPQNLPFGKGGGGGSDRGAYPEQNPNVQTGGAPAGKTFGSDLPVKSSSGSNVKLGTYTANSDKG